MFSSFFLSFSACQAINEINKPKDGETGRQKWHRLNQDPRGKPDAPIFLRPHQLENSHGDDGVPPPKGPVFRPNWGFRRGDTVIGSTKHSMDWSYHSVTPHDYTDVVTAADIPKIEHLGTQALATVCSFTFKCLFLFLPLHPFVLICNLCFSVQHILPSGFTSS